MPINFLTWNRYHLARFPHLRLPIFCKLRFVCSKRWRGRDTGGCRRGLTRGRRWGGGGRGSAPPSTGSARCRWCCPESWTRSDDSRRIDLKFVNIVNNLSYESTRGNGHKIEMQVVETRFFQVIKTFSKIVHKIKTILKSFLDFQFHVQGCHSKKDSISWLSIFQIPVVY